MSDHPSEMDFAAFLQGGTSRSASSRRNARILRHLLSNCGACRERLRAMSWQIQSMDRLLQTAETAVSETRTPATREYDYGPAFVAAERAVSAFLASDSQDVNATRILAELDAFPAHEQVHRAKFGAWSSPEVVLALIDRSHAARYRDAEEMLHFAHLAQLAADACPPAEGLAELRLVDLRARAWGQYGNALRVSGRPREAEEALVITERHRTAGTGDPMLRGWLFKKAAPLAVFQGRFQDAITMCEEAGEIYHELGQGHLLASTLVQKATATLYSGEAERAVRILNQAIPLIDHEEDPHLLLVACHNLVRCFIDLGRPDQALQIYSEIKELYEEFEDPLILLRATWQEGQLLRDLGHLEPAETILLRARKGYTERKLAYEAALVSLDLATVYVKRGQVDKLKRTVLETVPIFHSLRVGLETLASLLQLQKVADQEQQALDLIRALSARIEPLRRQRVEEN